MIALRHLEQRMRATDVIIALTLIDRQKHCALLMKNPVHPQEYIRSTSEYKTTKRLSIQRRIDKENPFPDVPLFN